MTSLQSCFLTGLRRRGVVLRGVDGRIIVESPAGVLTPADRQELARHKPALLAVVCELRLLASAERAVRTATPADLAPRLRVIQMYREVLCDYFAGRLDPLRLEIAGAVEGLVARWCILLDDRDTPAPPKGQTR